MKSVYLAAFAVGLLQGADLKIVADLQGSHARHRSIVGNVTDDVFEKMALEFLGSNDVTLGTFVVYGSVQDRVAAGPRGFDHCSYGHWRAMVDNYEESHSGCPAIKEAIKIGSDTIIRTVRADCRRTSRVVQGATSPLRLEIEGEHVEVLALQLGPLTNSSKDHRIVVNVFSRTDSPLTANLAKALTSRLVGLTGVSSIGVVLRGDAWFVTDCAFPAVYAFENRGKIPTLDEVARLPSAGCFLFSSGSKMQCGAAPALK